MRVILIGGTSGSLRSEEDELSKAFMRSDTRLSRSRTGFLTTPFKEFDLSKVEIEFSGDIPVSTMDFALATLADDGEGLEVGLSVTGDSEDLRSPSTLVSTTREIGLAYCAGFEGRPTCRGILRIADGLGAGAGFVAYCDGIGGTGGTPDLLTVPDRDRLRCGDPSLIVSAAKETLRRVISGDDVASRRSDADDGLAPTS